MSRLASGSLLVRALLALALLVGFYALALALAGLLLAIPVIEFAETRRVHAQVVLVCVAVAGAILWSIVPRPGKFEPPGPRIERGDEPALFAVIDDVARATGQAAPADVYLIPSVNAFVAQRGGFLGLGGRRFMGLGLPVFPALTVSEFRAVIAHEFGHYAGGDTRLGGILHATHMAIGRTLQSLRAESGRIGPLQWPFLAYATLFHRITRAVSREQEREADRRAACIAGARALDSGLRKLTVLEPAFQAYLDDSLNYALASAVRPPIAAGLAGFLAAPNIHRKFAADQAASVELSRAASAERRAEEARYDSHPPLHERIEALAEAPESPDAPDDRSAAELIADWDPLERELLGRMLASVPVEVMSWEASAERLYLPEYRAVLDRMRDVFAGTRIGELGQDVTAQARRIGAAWVALESDGREKLEDLQCVWQGARIAGCAIAVTLHGAGWTPLARPGEGIRLERDGRSIEPINAMIGRFDGSTSLDDWNRTMDELGIGDWNVTLPARTAEEEAARHPGGAPGAWPAAAAPQAAANGMAGNGFSSVPPIRPVSLVGARGRP